MVITSRFVWFCRTGSVSQRPLLQAGIAGFSMLLKGFQDAKRCGMSESCLILQSLQPMLVRDQQVMKMCFCRDPFRKLFHFGTSSSTLPAAGVYQSIRREANATAILEPFLGILWIQSID